MSPPFDFCPYARHDKVKLILTDPTPPAASDPSNTKANTTHALAQWLYDFAFKETEPEHPLRSKLPSNLPTTEPARTREIAHEFLARNSTILVDYYQCAELVGPYAKLWMDYIEWQAPKLSLVKKIFLAWIWDRDILVKKCAQLAIEQATRPVDREGLRIAQPLIDSINRWRSRAIYRVLKTIRRAKNPEVCKLRFRHESDPSLYDLLRKSIDEKSIRDNYNPRIVSQSASQPATMEAYSFHSGERVIFVMTECFMISCSLCPQFDH
ncbi:uncharacterized protein BP01DRAFT_382604 [Aspergillus saccharolyticus JOP 1030-1]|uniref:Uncharacterized protein n=1 Tax=Aspergillus saccharolyticus JOP 1030-1 TaxID=1450539 RepID=A0A318ZMB3_9EURO|nr:hypothetical protein BP01DRAFT_382604 [Aspergillus saccharolyticus JOP 1030-1]PYH45583.1 hypothetical protein BP01DRAFT_382604 [Aspergillus saccharolyticus JOP 1030-1]